MTGKPVIPRERAKLDAEDAALFYLHEGGDSIASRFVDALESAFHHLSKYPGAGSIRLANEIGIPELRSWPLQSYPFLVFYRECDGHIDVLRVLNSYRDIPAWMSV